MSILRSFISKRYMSKTFNEMNEVDYKDKYEMILSKSDIDGWELRKTMCDMHGMDMIPSPEVIKAGLCACRRNDDFALAIRFLEAIKIKCGHKQNIWTYLLSEIETTMDELGIETPDKLGYHKPELALKSVFEDDFFGITK